MAMPWKTMNEKSIAANWEDYQRTREASKCNTSADGNDTVTAQTDFCDDIFGLQAQAEESAFDDFMELLDDEY